MIIIIIMIIRIKGGRIFSELEVFYSWAFYLYSFKPMWKNWTIENRASCKGKWAERQKQLVLSTWAVNTPSTVFISHQPEFLYHKFNSINVRISNYTIRLMVGYSFIFSPFWNLHISSFKTSAMFLDII